MKNIYIRAFRAIDDSKACLKFIDGHRRVLDIVGVNDVTSSNNEWMKNPNVYVILIESGDRSQVYGGSRVHIADGINPLPLEEATSDIDIKVTEVVKKQVEQGTGEICGLWNSLEMAGYGIGSTYAIRSAICILPQINLKTCFALCSPYTARIASNYGFQIERSLGNDGTFYYPKIDLLATITFVDDTEILKGSNTNELEIIKSLREFSSQEKVEIGPKGKVQVKYDLSLDSI